MDVAGDLEILFLDDSTAATISGVEVQVLFDEPDKGVALLGDQIYDTAPSCTMRTSDVLANSVTQESLITINGITYCVIEVMGAGPGLSRFMLTTDF